MDCRNDGNIVAVAGADRDVKIIDQRSGEIVKVIGRKHRGNLYILFLLDPDFLFMLLN